MHRPVALGLLVALLAAPLAAQTVQGTVVTKGSHLIRGGVHVILVDDSLRAVRETDTDSTLGAFYLEAPRRGRYSLAVYDRLRNPYASAPFNLDSGAVLELKFDLPALPPAFDSLPVVSYLKPGPPEHRGAGIRYPDGEKSAGHTGHAHLAFIVDADGTIERDSYYVVDATNMAFARAATALDGWVRFPPASADGRAPRVVTQLTVAFNLAGAPPESGDLVITALGIAREKP